MSILKSLIKTSGSSKIFYNTGTIFDIASGSFRVGKDGSSILDGGCTITNGVVGREQTFKSAISLSYFGRMLKNYPEAEGLVYDTEYSISDSRIPELSGMSQKDFDERVNLVDKSDYDMDSFFELLVSIKEEKTKRRKDLTLETPFIDHRTGKPIRTLRPTIVLIDSWSIMSSSDTDAMFEKGKLDKTVNTSELVDGNKKSKMMKQLPTLCKKAGIILLTTAHVGSKVDMSMFNGGMTRDLPSMRASDKVKGSGTQFKFLLSNMIDTRTVSYLQNSTKGCLYPIPGSPDVELVLVKAIVCRNKNNMSAYTLPHVVSQKFGIQSTLDYYHMMKEAKISPFADKGKKKLTGFDKAFSHNTIRSMVAEDKRLERAIEIIGQFYCTKLYMGYDILPNWSVNEFADLLLGKDSALTDDILASTGVWQFTSSKQDLKYMSIIDIVRLVSKYAKK